MCEDLRTWVSCDFALFALSFGDICIELSLDFSSLDSSLQAFGSMIRNVDGSSLQFCQERIEFQNSISSKAYSIITRIEAAVFRRYTVVM